MNSRHGKTKIICTIGPATSSVDTIVQLIEAGMDVARLNFSHGTHEEHKLMVERLREAMQRTGSNLALLQDLQGPKIRIGQLDKPSIDVPTGSTLVITTDDIVGTTGRVSTSFTMLTADVSVGDSILLDDGKIRLTVDTVTGNDVRCRVINGGVLTPRKGINLPNVAVSAPAFTEKDLDDLSFGLSLDIDMVALSFVRSAEDITALRSVMRTRWGETSVRPIIAKIEKPQAIANIHGIVDEADAVMIARGDLGVEMPPEDVPVLQKRIVRHCNDAGKTVIIATQMLESMIQNETPTRAEASDVANAVIDGGDAVMLSGETSVGKHPVGAVAMMQRIIAKVEGERLNGRFAAMGTEENFEDRHDALGRAACVLAQQMNARAIVALTHSGQTARLAAKYRPWTPLIAVTDSLRTLRQLSVVWGVRGIVASVTTGNSDDVLRAIEKDLVKAGLVERGDPYVLIAGQPFFAGGSTNFIRLERVD